jgi:lysozyme
MFLLRRSFKEKLYEHIKLREGVKNVVYLDSVGKPTGGIGHLLNAKEIKKFPLGTVLEDSLIEDWLTEDIQTALKHANNQCSLLGVYSKDFKIALTSVNFQLGGRWIKKFPSAWKCLCDKRYDDAIDEILYQDVEEKKHSLWYKQTPTRVKDFIQAIEIIKEKK